MKASEMPFGFFMHRPDKSSERDFYYFKEHIGMMDELLFRRRDEIQGQELLDDPFAHMDRGDQIKTLEDFGRIVKHNNFIAAVSMFEKQFKNVIDYFTLYRPEIQLEKLVLKGRSGTNLQQYFNYVKRIMRVDIGEQWDNLKELNKYYLYRNVIIHNIGYLDMPKDKETCDFLMNFSTIDIQEKDGRTTIMNNSFTIDFCSKAERFVVSIFDTMNVDSRFSKLNN